MSKTPLMFLVSELASILEEAIDKKDWDLVCQAYSELTGETKEIEDEQSMVINDLKSEILASIREELKQAQKQPSTKAKPSAKNKSKLTTAKKQVDANLNKFEQMQQSYNEEAFKENGFDKINDKVQPSQRTRKAFTMAKITCSECGKSNEVHPMFVKENYVCDRCLRRRTGK
jgi:hypothetical protein